MSRLSVNAVRVAIEQLASIGTNPAQNSSLEAFLVAKRLAAKGSTPTTGTVNEVVQELFFIFPDHPNGRLQPFRNGGEEAPTRLNWRQTGVSGRRTTWNVNTRGNSVSRQLFVQNDIRHGLAADAPQTLKALLATDSEDRRPPREALLVYLLRDHSFTSPSVTLDVLKTAARAHYGLTDSDLDAITRPHSLSASLDGDPAWSASALPHSLQPPAEGTNPPTTFTPPVHLIPLTVDARIRRMIKRAISSSRAVLLVGPPGTGKSTLLQEIIHEMIANPAEYGLGSGAIGEPLWATAEEGWTSRELIGGETVAAGQLVFRPGYLLRAIRDNRWLVIDELNRADLDRIFGPAFTWLSGAETTPAVDLGRVSTQPGAPSVELAWSDQAACRVERAELLDGSESPGSGAVRFLSGQSWRLLGTYNAVDAQRVFRIGQALGRRFVRVPVPPMSVADFRLVLAEQELDTDQGERVAQLYEAHLSAPETLMGPALFFRMAEYLQADVPEEHESSPDGNAPPQGAATPTEAELFAEAYLINIGPAMTRLDDQQLVQLSSKVVGEAKPLRQEDWEWIRSMLPNLG